jgi:hypothetical protein
MPLLGDVVTRPWFALDGELSILCLVGTRLLRRILPRAGRRLGPHIKVPAVLKTAGIMAML